jgi:hypothetical protein
MPSDLGARLAGFERIIVPELNLGQLALLLRSELPSELVGRLESKPKVQGKPFKERELVSFALGAERAAALYDEGEGYAEGADDSAALIQIDDARR